MLRKGHIYDVLESSINILVFIFYIGSMNK